MKKKDRILGRILAKELKPEELGLVSIPDKVGLVAGGHPSTFVATFPDFHEDQ